jgi:hypothetical protein
MDPYVKIMEEELSSLKLCQLVTISPWATYLNLQNLCETASTIMPAAQ